MKKGIQVLCLVFITMLSGCVIVPVKTTTTAGNSGKVPPGQMKKATGSQSAKPYAPGQQKSKKKK